jgi:thiol-disulfide isomerase/thioredoxin
MKKFAPLVVLLFVSVLTAAQQPYEVLVERPNEKSYKGTLTKELILADTTFKWYAMNRNGYQPNADALQGLQKGKDSLQLLVFMGTWCEDSQFIIPKFFALTEAAGFSNNRITLIGVDRNKKTYSHLTDALNITNVPTIMVMKNGKELGRVVEYGKYGVFDKELGEILKATNQ